MWLTVAPVDKITLSNLYKSLYIIFEPQKATALFHLQRAPLRNITMNTKYF